jgi:hypothetical protein
VGAGSLLHEEAALFGKESLLKQRITLSDEDLRDAVKLWLYERLGTSFEWTVTLGAKSVSFQPGESDLHWVAEVTAERES